jgi:hypothetical protein
MDRIGNVQPGARKLIGLLLALNLGVFLAGMALQRWLPGESAPLVFNAEKIRLLAAPASSGARQSVAVQAPADAVVENAPLATAKAESASRSRCLSWTSLDAEALLAIETHLRQLGMAANAYDIELANEPGRNLSWWVFLPPLESKAALQAKMEEARRLGVSDLAPVRGGSMRNALSLGAFAKLEQARAHAAALADKGIKDVKFGPRPGAGAARLVFSARVADSALPSAESGWPEGLRPARCALP